MRLFKVFNRKKPERGPSPFYKTGFHGDAYLIDMVDAVIKGCEYFIETGTNVGSTLAYVAKTYPMIKCLSCEPDSTAFEEARKNTAQCVNVTIYNDASEGFIRTIYGEYNHLFDKDVFFWLDAHGYGFKWHLKEELSFITENFKRAYIFIDDFKVPGKECFKFGICQGQVCSFEFIKDSLSKKRTYRLYYPDYSEKTSLHHPLTGWGLIEFGHESPLKIPMELQGKIRSSTDA